MFPACLGPETKPHGAEGSGEGAKLPVSTVMVSAAGGKRETGTWGTSSVGNRKLQFSKLHSRLKKGISAWHFLSQQQTAGQLL